MPISDRAWSRPCMLLLLCILCCSHAVAADRPNIVFILVDDVGWGEVFPEKPTTQVALPALSSLASQGIRFNDAHTSAAKCAPSRYSILTGNYQWRGLRSWGQWNYKAGSQVLDGQATLATLLKGAGYTSSYIGKSHLGGRFYEKGKNSLLYSNDDARVDFARPMQQGFRWLGFDYSYALLRGIQESPYAYFENDLLVGNPADLITFEKGHYPHSQILKSGPGLPGWNQRDTGPELLNKALSFIDSHTAGASAASPFFLYYNTQAVHGPNIPPDSISGRNVAGVSGISPRVDMLVEIDAVVEAVTNKLQSLGLLDNTIIIFSSDNGGQRLPNETSLGHDSNAGLRGDKGTIYEGGHRVPLIIKWGNGFKNSSLAPGSGVDGLVGVQDVFATLAELFAMPVDSDDARDSISFLPLLLGQTDKSSRISMIHEADAPERGALDGIKGRHFSYRFQDWKLVFNDQHKPVGLYKISDDLFERNNLVRDSRYAGVVQDLVNKFEDEFSSERTSDPVSPEPPIPPGPSDPPVNSAPQVNFVSSGPGTLLQGERLVLSATASDAEDGDISSAIRWSSSLDGDLGTGSSIDRNDLSVGTHTLTVSVSDSGGLSQQSSLTLSVVAGPDGFSDGLASIQDSFINAKFPKANFGSGNFVRVDYLEPKISYLQFDLGGLAESIQSARLSLAVDQVDKDGTVSVHLISSSWSEGTLNGKSLPEVDDAVVTTFRVSKQDVGKRVSVDLSLTGIQWQQFPASNYGIALRPASNVKVSFNSKESGNGPIFKVSADSDLMDPTPGPGPTPGPEPEPEPEPEPGPDPQDPEQPGDITPPRDAGPDSDEPEPASSGGGGGSMPLGLILLYAVMLVGRHRKRVRLRLQ